MKTHLLKLLLFIVSLSVPATLFAQETSDNATYYYNNFETTLGAAGVGNATQANGNTTIDRSSTSPINGSQSLSSINTNSVGAIKWDFLGNGTGTIDLSANDYEWNFIYKNNSTTGPADPDQMAAGVDSWRYWLVAGSSSYAINNMQGIYITHSGGALSLRYRYDNAAGGGRYNQLLNVTMANDQNTYMIKVQRLRGGSWAIYKDVFVAGMTSAKTLVASSTDNTGSDFKTYYYSYLESTSTTAGRFKWDNFDMYTRVLQLTTTGANSASNGITQPSYYPNQSVILYGLKIFARGNFVLNQMVIGTSASSPGFEGYFNNAGSLYRSIDDSYSVSNDALISAVNYTGNSIQNYNVNDIIATSGNTDGTYSVPGYYFFTGTIKSQLNYGNTPYGTITITGVTTLAGNGNSTPLASASTSTTSSSTPITFANGPTPTISYASPQTLTVGTAVTINATTSNNPTSYSTSGLPSGLTLNTSNGQITGTPTTSSAATDYVITASNANGSSSATIRLTVNANPPTTPIDINTATNTIPENSAAGTLTNVTAYAYDPNLTSNTTNLALNRPVTVTSLEGNPPAGSPGQFPATAAVDGQANTRWSSSNSNPQSITVDLGAVYDISRVRISWENAYATSFQIQVSTDGSTFNTIKTINNATGLANPINDVTGLSTSNGGSIGRWVRILGTARSLSAWGYSIWELEVYRSGVNYSLSDNAGNRFTIDQGTGVITSGSVATDYETVTSHNVTVVATTASGTSSQTFNIAVSDVNDNTPVITSTNTASISEGTTAVKTITATDADGTSPNNTITTYAIAGGTNASLFTINATTGALSFITAPVYSTSGSNTYVVNVTAKDGGTPALTSTAQAITVTVTRSTFDSYAYRMPITLQSQGIGMSGNLTNFPVLVSVQNNADLVVTAGVCTNKIQYPAGPNYDIAFVDAAGNELNYQIEKYDASTGTLLAWVKIPVLYSAANTTLYLYFGRAFAPTNHTTTFANATWSNVTATPTTYQAVWHFNEAPSTTTSAVLDATGSGDNLIASRTQVAQNTSSIIQNGITLNGGTLSKSIATGLAALNTSFTMSSWVYYTAYPNYADNVMVLQDGGSYIQMAFRGTANNSVSANVGGGGILVSSNLTPAANAWHHIVYSYNGSTNSIYVDGALANTSTTGPNTGTPNTIVFGSYAIGNVENFTGTVDEARLINTTLSADWVKAEYANQRAPLTFCVTGTTTTDATNVLTIPGGVVYTYNGTTYTPNVAGVSATPSFNGKESFILSGNTTLGGNYSAYAVTVNNGVTFNLNGQTLNVACNVVNNGTISSASDNSTLNFNGTTAAQTFTAGATTNVATTGKLTVNNTSSTSPGLTVKGGPFNITSLLTITSGNLIIDNASNGTLTLKSTATQTANVAAIPAAYSVTGNVRVERYFTGGSANSRGYRLLSSPVSVSAASKILPNLLYLKDNAYLTGTGGVTNGFDVAGNPTLYFYRENLAPSYLSFLTSNFRGVKTINTGSSFTMDNETPSYTLPAGNGFLFFFRGNRASNATTNTAALANTATFVSSGYLNQGDVTVTHWYTGGNLQYNVITGNQNVRGFNLVGNPYASSIDWDGAGIITSSSISSTIWVYNPQRKIYATYIKGSGGVGTNFNGGAANIIPSGQGFMVRATSNSPIPSVKFTEAAKVATQVASTNLLMSTGGATSTTQPLQYMRLELSKDSLNREDALIFFKSTSKDVYVNNEDAEYLRGNNTLTMSTLSSDRKDVAINSIPYPKNNTTVIPVNSNISVSGLYQINLTEAKNIPDLYEVYLIDMLKKDSLDILRNKTYNFNAVAGDSTTFGNKRFKLVIRQKASMALRLLDFSASKVSSGAQLDWTTENERDYTNFTVERSTDGGKTFDVIGGVASADKGNYFLIDKNPVNGLNQYRLKQDDVNGAISYSKIVNLMYSKTAGSSVAVNNVAVFPNPATTTINVGITEQANSPVYAIRITDGLGMVVRSVTTTQTTWQTNISGLLPGTYFVQVTNNTTKAIVGNGKFIKQ